jgi:antitoxin (DNA-binding transcriptional repressor) of toxin-antitoxin stability system
MRFLSVREMRAQSSELWKTLATENEVVLTHHGKPTAIITGVDEASFESTLMAIRRQRGKDALTRLRAQAQASGAAKMSDAEISAEIDAARREKKA